MTCTAFGLAGSSKNFYENYATVLSKENNTPDGVKRYQFANWRPLVTRNGDNHHISNTEPPPIHYLLGKNSPICFTSAAALTISYRDLSRRKLLNGVDLLRLAVRNFDAFGEEKLLRCRKHSNLSGRLASHSKNLQENADALRRLPGG